MKHGISFLLVIIFSSISIAKAEKKSFSPELRIGPSFGINLSQVSFSPSISQNFALKYNGGITVRYISESYFGLQGELNYSMRGWQRNFPDEAIDAGKEYTRSLNYLEIPLMSHIYFGKKVVRGFINLGPKIGFLLSEKEQYNFSITTDEDKSRFNEIGKVTEKKFDWGLCGGAGMEIHTKAGSFILEGRYYFGLGNIFNSRKADPFSKSAFSTISVNFVYLIPIRLSPKTVQ